MNYVGRIMILEAVLAELEKKIANLEEAVVNLIHLNHIQQEFGHKPTCQTCKGTGYVEAYGITVQCTICNQKLSPDCSKPKECTDIWHQLVNSWEFCPKCKEYWKKPTPDTKPGIPVGNISAGNAGDTKPKCDCIETLWNVKQKQWREEGLEEGKAEAIEEMKKLFAEAEHDFCMRYEPNVVAVCKFIKAKLFEPPSSREK